eukprot:15224551-Alexandrium_andersonii.AAC.1
MHLSCATAPTTASLDAMICTGLARGSPDSRPRYPSWHPGATQCPRGRRPSRAAARRPSPAH